MESTFLVLPVKFHRFVYLFVGFFSQLHHLLYFIYMHVPLLQLQGVCQPAMSSVVSAWAPKSERARIVGFSYSGT